MDAWKYNWFVQESSWSILNSFSLTWPRKISASVGTVAFFTWKFVSFWLNWAGSIRIMIRAQIVFVIRIRPFMKALRPFEQWASGQILGAIRWNLVGCFMTIMDPLTYEGVTLTWLISQNVISSGLLSWFWWSLAGSLKSMSRVQIVFWLKDGKIFFNVLFCSACSSIDFWFFSQIFITSAMNNKFTG